MNISAINLQNLAHVQKMENIKEASIKGNHSGATAQVDFSKTLTSILNTVNEQQVAATNKINAVELGKSDDMIGAVVAAQQASLSFSALMQVRNKLVTGFDEIMKMSV